METGDELQESIAEESVALLRELEGGSFDGFSGEFAVNNSQVRRRPLWRRPVFPSVCVDLAV
jgi:hypothetical protein|eukprot:COSAG01_NODE_769_length_13735_cov_41.389410_14_plen_62_part_00